MTKDEFYEELGDEYEEVKKSFLSTYAHCKLEPDIDDPLGEAVFSFNEYWEHGYTLTEELAKPWLEKVKLAIGNYWNLVVILKTFVS